jgi:hypothetical protein
LESVGYWGIANLSLLSFILMWRWCQNVGN